MKPNEEEKITRWIDGELEDADVADILAAYPELRSERESAQALGNLLRQELETGDKIPDAEFFNRQVQRHIEEEQALAEQKKAYAAVPEKEFFSWFTFTRNLAAAALLVLLGVFIGKAFFDSRNAGSQVVYTYAPDPSIVANLYYSKSANATVLDLQGLDAIPAEKAITAHQTASYIPSSGGLVPTLYATDPQQGAFVLVKDHHDIPTVYSVDVPTSSRETF